MFGVHTLLDDFRRLLRAGSVSAFRTAGKHLTFVTCSCDPMLPSKSVSPRFQSSAGLPLVKQDGLSSFTLCERKRGSVASCSHRSSAGPVSGRGLQHDGAVGAGRKAGRGAELTYGGSLVSKLVTGSRGVDVELFGLSAADCKRLTTVFKQSKTWQELSMHLPRTLPEWAGVDTICLTAAFSSIVRVTARTPGAPHRPSLSSDPISRTEIGHALQLLTQLARARWSDFDSQGLVSVAVSLAKLQEYYSTDAEPSSSAAHPLIASRPPTSTANNLSRLLATDTHSSSPAPGVPLPLASVVDELLSHSRRILPRCSPQSLANLIWSLATLGQQPCGSWLTEYYRRVEEQLQVLGSRDVSNILWSLCKLDLMPDVWLRDSLVERSLAAVREQQQQQDEEARQAAAAGTAAPAGAAAAPAPAPGAWGSQGQDRATLIQCLARWYFLYNYRVPDEWICEYLRVVQPGLGSYLPFDLVSLIHSCVVMNYQPSRSWMAGYYKHVMHSLKHDPTLSYGDLQRLMWALSRIDFTPPLTWQREFVAVSVPKLKHLKIRALSEMVWALACWDCRPSPQWLAEYFTASGPRLQDARPQHISCQLSALAKLDVRVPGPWLDQALNSFCAQLADVKAHDLVTLLETIPVVCMDKSWLSERTDMIKELADTAASKFAVYDAVMHTKLCVALAAANVCPAADWLKKQQAALVACLRGGDVDSQAAAQSLREVYRTWDVEVDKELKALL